MRARTRTRTQRFGRLPLNIGTRTKEGGSNNKDRGETKGKEEGSNNNYNRGSQGSQNEPFWELQWPLSTCSG